MKPKSALVGKCLFVFATAVVVLYWLVGGLAWLVVHHPDKAAWIVSCSVILFWFFAGVGCSYLSTRHQSFWFKKQSRYLLLMVADMLLSACLLKFLQIENYIVALSAVLSGVMLWFGFLTHDSISLTSRHDI